MEALQTDVMRFMAILGLCLAAIFSLVKSPDFDPPVAVEPVSASELGVEASGSQAEDPVTEAAPEAVIEPLPQEEPPPASRPEEEQTGFSLEFASASSLGTLIDTGGVKLLVSDHRKYWAWSGQQGFKEALVPSRYYQMNLSTVPAQYKRALLANPSIHGLIWGVVLPEAISEQITALMSSNTGGVLVISARGVVTLDKDSG